MQIQRFNNEFLLGPIGKIENFQDDPQGNWGCK